MKIETTALDIAFLVQEIQPVVQDAKISKVYEDDKNVFSFVLWKPGTGKAIIHISLPHALWIDKTRQSSAEAPTHFCSFLRKRIEGGRITTIEHLPYERIVHFSISTKEESYHLYVELFSTGNVVLTSSTKEILGATLYRSWKTRSVKKGERYEPPQKKAAPENQTVSHYIATSLGCGKRVAFELCHRLATDPRKPLSQEDKERTAQLITTLLKHPRPSIVDQHLEPFPFQTTTQEKEYYDSVSDALHTLGRRMVTQPQPKKDRIHAAQERMITEHTQKAQEREQQGQLIYEQYQDIQTLFSRAKEAKKAKKGLASVLGATSGPCTISAVDEKKQTIEITQTE